MGLFNYERWTWKFRRLSDSDYELLIVLCTPDTFFMKVYKECVLRMARAHNKSVKGDPALIDEFDLDEKYVPQVKSYCKNIWNITRTDLTKQTGFHMMTYNVKGVKYVRDGKNWKVHLTLQGVFADKRTDLGK